VVADEECEAHARIVGPRAEGGKQSLTCVNDAGERQSCAWAGCAAMATPFGTPLRGATEFPALGDPATLHAP
jgi:hypothetical protein